MSWLERVSAAPPDTTTEPMSTGQTMKLGHPAVYDTQLWEKASCHNPPTPPEYMGFEGEYDSSGLAKRIAKKLDEDSQVEEVPSLTIVQREAMICFEGNVSSQHILKRIMAVAAHVDGVQAVDVSKVQITPGS